MCTHTHTHTYAHALHGHVLPIMVVCCQDNGGGGVSIAGNPGAVHGKEGQHQHEEEVDHGASIEELLHPTS